MNYSVLSRDRFYCLNFYDQADKMGLNKTVSPSLWALCLLDRVYQVLIFAQHKEDAFCFLNSNIQGSRANSEQITGLQQRSLEKIVHQTTDKGLNMRNMFINKMLIVGPA